MSNDLVRTALANQYGAALDMLENAIRACPDVVWDDDSVPVAQRFWYLAFHTLWWHDHYFAASTSAHTPPAPYTRDELDPAGVYPAHAYTKEQLLAFLEHDRQRCRARFATLTDAEAAAHCGSSFHPQLSWLEMCLYNLRHLQHHTAQLNLVLRQRTDSAPRWVSRGARV